MIIKKKKKLMELIKVNSGGGRIKTELINIQCGSDSSAPVLWLRSGFSKAQCVTGCRVMQSHAL